MRKLTLLITFLAIAILITSCQAQQKVPSAPGAITPTPIGGAGAALPNWAVDAGTAVDISPEILTLSGTQEKQTTVTVSDDYVWKTVYALAIREDGTLAWIEFPLDCTPIEETNWCAGSASTVLAVNLGKFFPGTNYVIAYTCSWDAAAEEFDCNGNRWKIAVFGVNQTAAAAVSLTNTAAYGITATINR